MTTVAIQLTRPQTSGFTSEVEERVVGDIEFNTSNVQATCYLGNAV